MVVWNGVIDHETLLNYLERGLIREAEEMVLACEETFSSDCHPCPFELGCNKLRSLVLTLRLKREFYDAIQRGDKLIEYRDATPYWEKRIKNKRFVRFFIGYPPRTVKPMIRLIEKTVLVGDQYHIYLVNPVGSVYVGEMPKILGEASNLSKGLTSTTTIEKYGSEAV